MMPSEVLRRAAKIVEDGGTRWGCHAIAMVCDSEWESVNDLPGYNYFLRFKPSNVHMYGSWFADQHNARILALCFAAAVAESEGE